MGQKAAYKNLQTSSLKLPKAILSTELGNRQQATGNRQQATGNRQQATGNRQQATGNRQQATGNRQQYTLLNNRVNYPIVYILFHFAIYFALICFYYYYSRKNAVFSRTRGNNGFFYIPTKREIVK